MKQPEAPCLFCDERELGCHVTCDKYRKYAKEQKKYREYITRQRLEEDDIEAIEIQRFRK